MASVFRVRDRVTNKFWNGSYRRSVFDDKGTTWKKRDGAERTISHFVRYRNRYSMQTSQSLPRDWEIVEYELVENEKSATSIQGLLNFTLLRDKVSQEDSRMAQFLDTMQSKGVLDQIEYLILLKSDSDYGHVSMDVIKEARAHLRQLGVKTRSFREGGGVFGMMDRAQALKARLVLDVGKSLDLRELRDQLGI